MASPHSATAVSKSRGEYPARSETGLRAIFHKCARLAHLWTRAPHENPYLCRAKSTFPPMTTGTISGILESYLPNNPGGGALKASHTGHQYTHHPYSSRRYLELIQAARSAPAWRQKGRKHEVNTVRMVASGSGRGEALRLLRCTPRTGPQFEPVVAARIPTAARHQHRAESVPVLPPAPPGPSHWSCYQHSNLRTPRAISTSPRPTSNSNIEDIGEGRPSFQAWADGRQDQL